MTKKIYLKLTLSFATCFLFYKGSGQVSRPDEQKKTDSVFYLVLNEVVVSAVTNMLNHYYRSFLGGPEIGTMVYTTLTYGINRAVIKLPAVAP